MSTTPDDSLAFDDQPPDGRLAIVFQLVAANAQITELAADLVRERLYRRRLAAALAEIAALPTAVTGHPVSARDVNRPLSMARRALDAARGDFSDPEETR